MINRINKILSIILSILVPFIVTISSWQSAAENKNNWWNTFDYGQVSAQVLSRDNDDPLLRGRAVKLLSDEQAVSAFYDVGSMNLRYVTFGEVVFKGTPWDGAHGGNSLIGGELFFKTGKRLAWQHKGSWQDPRTVEYAPLAHDYIHFKGTYRFNEKVIFNYSVGANAVNVYEMPQAIMKQKQLTFIRHFNVAPSKQPLTVKLFENNQLVLGKDIFIRSNKFNVQQDQAGIVSLSIPASNSASEFYVTYSKQPNTAKLKPEKLTQYLTGGKLRWPESFALKGQVKSDENDTFIVDQIPLPFKNPYSSKIRVGGFDYFSDSSKIAIATWSGDVWVATGVDTTLNNVVWKRFASGLNEALGLRIVNDVIYVTGKDQITRLHDLNNDGEADLYENFNNDVKITANFHEFTFGLQTDDAGNFYFAKASPVRQGGRGFETTHDNHGAVMKITADGKQAEIFASGIRASGGLSVNGAGTIVTTGENEGTYVPACKVNYAEKGDFLGVKHPGNAKQSKKNITKPLCYLPMDIDNSGGGQVWVPENAWGDMGGSLIHLSFGKSSAYLVLKEKLNGQIQGGVIKLPIKLMSSGMRARFNPNNNNEMTIVGFKGWGTNATLPAAINRVTYKGHNFPRVAKLKPTAQGVYLSFNQALDQTSATDLSNYNIERWNYVYSEQYGSAHFATDTPKKVLDSYTQKPSKTVGRIGIPNDRAGEQAYITAAKLMPDKQTVFLKVHNMKPVDQMKIDYAVKTAAGNTIKQSIYNTIYNLHADNSNVPDTVTIKELEALVKLNTYEIGTKVTIQTEHGEKDAFVNRLLNLQVKTGDSVTPMVKAGAFSAEYQGYLQVKENDNIVFNALGNGELNFQLNGKHIVSFNGENQVVTSEKITLKKGFHTYRLTYKTPTNSAYFDLHWQGERFAMGPISPHSLRVLADGETQASSVLKAIRNDVADKRCFSCHTIGVDKKMPELQQDSPSLENVGARLNQAWLVQWMTNPQKLRKQAHMPRVVNGKEAADIAAFLTQKSGINENQYDAKLTGNITAGGGLFYDLGCIACHTRPETLASKSKNKGKNKDNRISLAYLAAKFKPQALKAFLLAPEANYKWTKMPNFNLSEQEANNLATYLYSASKVKNIALVKGNAKAGEQLFKESRCANCHEKGNESEKMPLIPIKNIKNGCTSTPKVNNSVHYLFKDGKYRRAIGNFAKSKGKVFSNISTHDFAERQITALNCQACHDRDDKKSLWQHYEPEVSDLKVEHQDKGHLDQSRPPLTYAGEKLYQSTLHDYLSGTLAFNSRDWLLARMPAFPARAELLSQGLALQHGAYQQQGNQKIDVASKQSHIYQEVGKKLVGDNAGFACTICHGLGENKPTAAFEVEGVNFKSTAQRLRPNYFYRWMMNPRHIEPTTKMPKYFMDDGTSPMPDFDHSATEQIKAMHQYLLSIE